MDVNYLVIGKRIKKCRLEKGLTQEKLSDLIGISKAHMSHIETGTTKLGFPVLCAIANALDVGFDYLMGENLKTSVSILRKEIEEIISDCNAYELRCIIDSMITSKSIIRYIQYINTEK